MDNKIIWTAQEIMEQLGISLFKHNKDKIRDFTKQFLDADEVKKVIKKYTIRNIDDNADYLAVDPDALLRELGI